MTTKTEPLHEPKVDMIGSDGYVNFKQFTGTFSYLADTAREQLLSMTKNLNIPYETARRWYFSSGDGKVKPNHYTNFILKFIALNPEVYTKFSKMTEFNNSKTLQMSAEQYRTCRAILGLSQLGFAEITNAPISTVKAYEAGRRLPSPIASKFIWLVAHDDELYDIYVRYLDKETQHELKATKGAKAEKKAEKEAKKAEKEAKKAEKEAKKAEKEAKKAEKEAKKDTIG